MVKSTTGRFSERVLSLAVTGLGNVESGRTLDDVVDDVRSDPVGSVVADILFKYYRRKGVVDYLLSMALSSIDAGKLPARTRRLAVVVMVQSLFQTGVPPESAANVAVGFLRRKAGGRTAGFLNAILRTALSMDLERTLADAPECVAACVPELFLQRWSEAGGSRAKLLLEARQLIEAQPPLAFRVVGNSISDAELADAGCSRLSVPGISGEFHFYHTCQPFVFFKRGWVDDGRARVQDPATALPIALLEGADVANWKNGLVLDLCSAPGGKTLRLAELLNKSACLVACDISKRRMNRLLVNLDTADTNVCCVVSSALAPPFLPESADLVILDVPCSNTGVFRRRPDVLWNFSERKLAELTMLQKAILDAAANLIKHGGVVLYSTCSLEAEENEECVKNFVNLHPEFRKVSDQLLFPTSHNDGAYAAVLLRD